MPKDWNDLLKPAYKNLIAMIIPAYSGLTYPLIAFEFAFGWRAEH